MWGWREGQLYKSIIVSSKNKYEPVMDDGSVETKGLAIAKDGLMWVMLTL